MLNTAHPGGEGAAAGRGRRRHRGRALLVVVRGDFRPPRPSGSGRPSAPERPIARSPSGPFTAGGDLGHRASRPARRCRRCPSTSTPGVPRRRPAAAQGLRLHRDRRDALHHRLEAAVERRGRSAVSQSSRSSFIVCCLAIVAPPRLDDAIGTRFHQPRRRRRRRAASGSGGRLPTAAGSLGHACGGGSGRRRSAGPRAGPLSPANGIRAGNIFLVPFLLALPATRWTAPPTSASPGCC